MILTAQQVNEVLIDCLFRDDEDRTDHVVGEAVMLKAGFHPGRLEQHKSDIMEMLLDLPSEFLQSQGGGWSFLNACVTREGNQWGEHRNIDELLALGVASGQAEIQLPREVWSALPGGVPYFVVKDGDRA
jgi:hypothetical protein